MYILIAILAFGILIFVHEMGHFVAAKSCGVKVLEFAMGMGPQILHRQVGETDYSLRLLPIGGFCAMEGEDEDSEDPRSFSAQPLWKKLIILVAGAAMNFLMGFLITALLFVNSTGFYSNRLDSFREGCPYEALCRWATASTASTASASISPAIFPSMWAAMPTAAMWTL